MRKSPFAIMLFILMLIAIMPVAVMPLAYAFDTIPAHAAPDVAPPIVTFLKETIFPVVTALFMGVVSVFLNRIGKKYNLDYLTQQNNLVEQLAYQGVTKAEEVAARFAGSKAALAGQDKLSMAVNHILSVMPKVSQAQAESVVHAILAQIPGIGATGGTAIERYPIGAGGVVAAPAAPAAPAESPQPEEQAA